eukprot:g5633.t1
MKIALCQLKVGNDKMKNMIRARAMIKEAARGSADLVVLPELWNCLDAVEKFPVISEPIPDPPNQISNANKSNPCFQMMKTSAKEFGIYLVGGSIPEIHNQKLYNTCCVFNPQGEFLAKYRKVHMFDIYIPGKIRFMESKAMTPGEKLTMFKTPFGRVGVGLCYDIRFPEMAQLYSEAGANLLLYPGAFGTTTGPAHWELLQRARAVDNQVFVAMCSPSRSENGYQVWGHSTVSGPFGEVLATSDETETIVYADLDSQLVKQSRSSIPLAKQKRLDLYKLVKRTLHKI